MPVTYPITVYDSGEFNKKQQSSTFQYYYQCTAVVNSQDSSAKTSNITLTMVMYCKSSGSTKWTGVANAYAPYGYINVWNGTAYDRLVTGDYISRYVTSTTPLVIAEYTGDFQHDSDGTLTLDLQFGWNTGSGSTANYRPASFTQDGTTEGIPTLAAMIRFKVNGSWVEGQPFVKVNGAWKEASDVFIKINGAWKENA